MTTARAIASTTIKAPPTFVFDFLADPTTAPLIDPAIREYRPDQLPMRVGTRNLIRMRIWGLPVRAESLVTEWVAGRRMVMEGVKPKHPVKVSAVHTFEDDGDDCRYTWTMEVEATGLLGRLIARRFASFLQSNADAQQHLLRAEVERRWLGGQR